MPFSTLLAIGAGIVLLARPIQGTLRLIIVVGVYFIADGEQDWPPPCLSLFIHTCRRSIRWRSEYPLESVLPGLCRPFRLFRPMGGESRRTSLFCANAGVDSSNIATASLYMISSQKCARSTDAIATGSDHCCRVGEFIILGKPKGPIDRVQIKSSNVSNIDQRLPNPEEHAGSITAPYWLLPVTESVALPPDARRASCHPSIPIHYSAAQKPES